MDRLVVQLQSPCLLVRPCYPSANPTLEQAAVRILQHMRQVSRGRQDGDGARLVVAYLVFALIEAQ